VAAPDATLVRWAETDRGAPTLSGDNRKTRYAAFQSDGSNSGVGLSGMRERVIELGGQLKLESSVAGTTLAAVIPLSKAISAKTAEAKDSHQKKRGSAA
jgi:signal transduction histidine kinase